MESKILSKGRDLEYHKQIGGLDGKEKREEEQTKESGRGAQEKGFKIGGEKCQ